MKDVCVLAVSINEKETFVKWRFSESSKAATIATREKMTIFNFERFLVIRG